LFKRKLKERKEAQILSAWIIPTRKIKKEEWLNTARLGVQMIFSATDAINQRKASHCRA
jgi:hypothetical protein